MRPHRMMAATLALAGVVATTTVLTPTVSVASPAPTTEVRPDSLDRGDAGRDPHVDGDDLVVGDRRYDFGDREVTFLGHAPDVDGGRPDGYLVSVHPVGRPGDARVVRVTPDDRRSVVLAGLRAAGLVLSSDGGSLFRSTYRPKTRTTVVRAWSTSNGDQLAAPVFKGYATVLDAHDGTAVVGASMPNRTFSWVIAQGDTQRISRHVGYQASIPQNRLAVLTGDPYVDGCSVVSRLSSPGRVLWRSCTQAVVGFSPSGDRVVTTYLQADGLGPNEYQLREVTGEAVRTFRSYYFGRVLWESDEVLLMDAHGKREHAWVTCTDQGDCERAGALRDNAA